MTTQQNQPSQATKAGTAIPSDAEITKFWGADLAKLTSDQKILIAKLFQALQQRRCQ